MELISGVVHLAGGSLASFAFGESQYNPGFLGIAIPALSIGLYQTIHAIYSFVEGGPPDNEQALDEPSVAVSLAPRDGGAVAYAFGRF